MIRKKKTKPLSWYKKKFWKVFSEWTRRKWANRDGIANCISCRVPKHWTELHAGHYVPASAGLSTYFEERNVNPQCPSCNIFRDGNMAAYALAMRQKYGENILEELDVIRRQDKKYSKSDYQEMTETYQKRIEALDAA